MTRQGVVIVLTVLLLVPVACYDPEPEPGVMCGENGMCPEGMTCDMRDNRCWREPLPECRADEECDDGDPCTDDRCGDSACEHVPNTGVACDDGVHCNGADTCADGACTVHGGDPCIEPTVCDESADMCAGCLEDSHCPAAESGEWSECGGFVDDCGQSGTRSRTVTTYTCEDKMCVPDTTTETEDCARSTEGDVCADDEYGSWGECGGFSDICDESGTHERVVTSYACSDESCAGMTGTDAEVCYRDTDGVSCGATSCDGWGTCGGFDDVCDESGTQSQTCTDPTCTSGTCSGVARTETQGCTRDTDGISCGTTMCEAWSACNFADICDETGTQSRRCTSYSCANAGCVATTYTEAMDCTRDTDGTQCAEATCGAWGTCTGFIDTCDESGTQSRTCTSVRICSNGVCPAGSTNSESQVCLRDTDGDWCDYSAGNDGRCQFGVCECVSVPPYSCPL